MFVGVPDNCRPTAVCRYNNLPSQLPAEWSIVVPFEDFQFCVRFCRKQMFCVFLYTNGTWHSEERNREDWVGYNKKITGIRVGPP